MPAGAFPPLERPDPFPKSVPGPPFPRRGPDDGGPVFARLREETRASAETLSGWRCGAAFYDALSPGFISSIFDESGLQRTVSGCPHHSGAGTQQRLPKSEIV